MTLLPNFISFKAVESSTPQPVREHTNRYPQTGQFNSIDTVAMQYHPSSGPTTGSRLLTQPNHQPIPEGTQHKGHAVDLIALLDQSLLPQSSLLLLGIQAAPHAAVSAPYMVSPIRQPISPPYFISPAMNGFNPGHQAQTFQHQQQQIENPSGRMISPPSFTSISMNSNGCQFGFSPSGMWIRARLLEAGLVSSAEHIKRVSRYQGTYGSANHNLPSNLNCALWITNIPVGVTISNIFDLIHEGAVWALHINKPTGLHTTQAAKLVFMNPSSSAQFYQRAHQGFGINFRGSRLNVSFNREGHFARSGRETRVLYIQGPANYMNPHHWIGIFQEACIFQLDTYGALDSVDPNYPRMEFRFARVDGQAQTCMQRIKRDPNFDHMVSVEYGFDPCENYASQ